MINNLSKINVLTRNANKYLLNCNTSTVKRAFQNGIKSNQKFPLAKNLSKFKSSKKIVLLVSGAGIGAIGVCFSTDFSLLNHSKWSSKLSEYLSLLSSKMFKFANCEAALKKQTKLTRSEDKKEKVGDEKKENDAFDWHEFFKLIKEEKFYFLAAICVL
jgi:hypothetical protein